MWALLNLDVTDGYPDDGKMSQYRHLKRAHSLPEAISEYKRIACPCLRQSFYGVSWIEGDVERTLTWDELAAITGGVSAPRIE